MSKAGELSQPPPPFTSKFLKLKLNLIPPPLFEMHAEEFIHSSTAFPKRVLREITQKPFISALKSGAGTL